jgi:hypothetical protein
MQCELHLSYWPSWLKVFFFFFFFPTTPLLNDLRSNGDWWMRQVIHGVVLCCKYKYKISNNHIFLENYRHGGSFRLCVKNIRYCTSTTGNLFFRVRFFSLLSLFWKNKRRLMRSRCCLCVCVSPLNSWKLEYWGQKRQPLEYHTNICDIWHAWHLKAGIVQSEKYCRNGHC